MKNFNVCLIFILLTIFGVNAQKSNSFNHGATSVVNSDNLIPTTRVDDVINWPVSIKDKLATNFELMVYPNPASTRLAIRLNGTGLAKPEAVFINVIDMRGRVVMAVKT